MDKHTFFNGTVYSIPEAGSTKHMERTSRLKQTGNARFCASANGTRAITQ